MAVPAYTITVRQGTPIVPLLRRDSVARVPLPGGRWRWTRDGEALHTTEDENLGAFDLYFVHPDLHEGDYELQYLDGTLEQWTPALRVHLSVIETWRLYLLRGEEETVRFRQYWPRWTVLEADRDVAAHEGLARLSEKLAAMHRMLSIDRHLTRLDTNVWKPLDVRLTLLLLRPKDAQFEGDNLVHAGARVRLNAILRDGPPLAWIRAAPAPRPFRSWAELADLLPSVEDQQRVYEAFSAGAYRSQMSTDSPKASGLYIAENNDGGATEVHEVHRIDTDAFALNQFAGSIGAREVEQLSHLIELNQPAPGVHSMTTKTGKTAVTLLEIERSSEARVGVSLAADNRYDAPHRPGTRVRWYLVPMHSLAPVPDSSAPDEALNHAPQRLVRLRYFLDATRRSYYESIDKGARLITTPIQTEEQQLLSFTVAQLDALLPGPQEAAFALLAFEETGDAAGDFPSRYHLSDEELPPARYPVRTHASLADAILAEGAEIASPLPLYGTRERDNSNPPSEVVSRFGQLFGRTFAPQELLASAQRELPREEQPVAIAGNPLRYATSLVPSVPSRRLLHIFVVALLSQPSADAAVNNAASPQLPMDPVLDPRKRDPENLVAVLGRIRERFGGATTEAINAERAKWEWVLHAARNRQRAFRFVREALLAFFDGSEEDWPSKIQAFDRLPLRRIRHSTDAFWMRGSGAHLPILPGQYERRLLYDRHDRVDTTWLEEVYRSMNGDGSLESAIRSIVNDDRAARLAYYLYTNHPRELYRDWIIRNRFRDFYAWILQDPDLKENERRAISLRLVLARYREMLQTMESQNPSHYYHLPMYMWRRHLVEVFSARLDELQRLPGVDLGPQTIEDIAAAARNPPALSEVHLEALRGFFDIPPLHLAQIGDWPDETLLDARALTVPTDGDLDERIASEAGVLRAQRAVREAEASVRVNALIRALESDSERRAESVRTSVKFLRPEPTLVALANALEAAIVAPTEEQAARQHAEITSFKAAARRIDSIFDETLAQGAKLASGYDYPDAVLSSMRARASAEASRRETLATLELVPPSQRGRFVNEVDAQHEASERALRAAAKRLEDAFSNLRQQIARMASEPSKWLLLAERTERDIRTMDKAEVPDWREVRWSSVAYAIRRHVLRVDRFKEEVLSAELNRISEHCAKLQEDLSARREQIRKRLREISLKELEEMLEDERNPHVASLTDAYDYIRERLARARELLASDDFAEIRAISELIDRECGSISAQLSEWFEPTSAEYWNFDQDTAQRDLDTAVRLFFGKALPAVGPTDAYVERVEAQLASLKQEAYVAYDYVLRQRAALVKSEEERKEAERRLLERELERAKLEAEAVKRADEAARERARLEQERLEREREAARRRTEEAEKMLAEAAAAYEKDRLLEEANEHAKRELEEKRREEARAVELARQTAELERKRAADAQAAELRLQEMQRAARERVELEKKLAEDRARVNEDRARRAAAAAAGAPKSTRVSFDDALNVTHSVKRFGRYEVYTEEAPAAPPTTVTVAPPAVLPVVPTPLSTEVTNLRATTAAALAAASGQTNLAQALAVLNAHRGIFGDLPIAAVSEIPLEMQERLIQRGEQPRDAAEIARIIDRNGPFAMAWRNHRSLEAAVNTRPYEHLLPVWDGYVLQDARDIRECAIRCVLAVLALETPFEREGFIDRMHTRHYLSTTKKTGYEVPALEWIVSIIRRSAAIPGNAPDINERTNPYSIVAKLHERCYQLLAEKLLPSAISILDLTSKPAEAVRDDLLAAGGYQNCIAVLWSRRLESVFVSVINAPQDYQRLVLESQAENLADAFGNPEHRCYSRAFDAVRDQYQRVVSAMHAELTAPELHQWTILATSRTSGLWSSWLEPLEGHFSALEVDARKPLHALWRPNDDDSRGATIAIDQFLAPRSKSAQPLVYGSPALYSDENSVGRRRGQHKLNPTTDARTLAGLATYSLVHGTLSLAGGVPALDPRLKVDTSRVLAWLEEVWIEGTDGDARRNVSSLAQLYHNARISTLYGVRYSRTKQVLDSLVGKIQFEAELQLLWNNRELVGDQFYAYWPVRAPSGPAARAPTTSPERLRGYLINEMQLNELIVSNIGVLPGDVALEANIRESNPYRAALFELLVYIRDWNALLAEPAGNRAREWSLRESKLTRLPTDNDEFWNAVQDVRYSPERRNDPAFQRAEREITAQMMDVMLFGGALEINDEGLQELNEKSERPGGANPKSGGGSATVALLVQRAFSLSLDEASRQEAARRLSEDIDAPRVLWPMLLAYRLTRYLYNKIVAIKPSGDLVITNQTAMDTLKALRAFCATAIYRTLITRPERAPMLPVNHPRDRSRALVAFDYFSAKSIRDALHFSGYALDLVLHTTARERVISTGEYAHQAACQLYSDESRAEEITTALLGQRKRLLVYVAIPSEKDKFSEERNLQRRFFPPAPLSGSPPALRAHGTHQSGDPADRRDNTNAELVSRRLRCFLRTQDGRGWVERSLYNDQFAGRDVAFRTEIGSTRVDTTNSIDFVEPIMPLSAYSNPGDPYVKRTGYVRIAAQPTASPTALLTNEQLVSYLSDPKNGAHLITEPDVYSSWLKGWYDRVRTFDRESSPSPPGPIFNLQSIANDEINRLNRASSARLEERKRALQEIERLLELVVKEARQVFVALSWPGASEETANQELATFIKQLGAWMGRNYSERVEKEFANAENDMLDAEVLRKRLQDITTGDPVQEKSTDTALRFANEVRARIGAYGSHYLRNDFTERSVAYENAKTVMSVTI